jgi:hypothetical protein
VWLKKTVLAPVFGEEPSREEPVMERVKGFAILTFKNRLNRTLLHIYYKQLAPIFIFASCHFL